MSDDQGVRSWEENLENLRKERAKKNERILQHTKSQSTIPQFDNVFDEVVDSENTVDTATVVSYYGSKSAMPEPVEISVPADSASMTGSLADEPLDTIAPSVEDMPDLVFEPVGEDFIKGFKDGRTSAQQSTSETETESVESKVQLDMVEFTSVEYAGNERSYDNVHKPVSIPPKTDDGMDFSPVADVNPPQNVKQSTIVEHEVFSALPINKDGFVQENQVVNQLRLDGDDKKINTEVKSEIPVSNTVEIKQPEPDKAVETPIEIVKKQDTVVQFDDHMVNNDEMFASFVLAQKQQVTKSESAEPVEQPEVVFGTDNSFSDAGSVAFFEGNESLSDMADVSSNAVGSEDEGHLSSFASSQLHSRAAMLAPPAVLDNIEQTVAITVDEHDSEDTLPPQEIFSIPIFAIDPSRKSIPDDEVNHQALIDAQVEDEEVTEIDSFPLPSSFSMFDIEPEFEAEHTSTPEIEDTPTMVSSEFLFMPEMLQEVESYQKPETEPASVSVEQEQNVVKTININHEKPPAVIQSLEKDFVELEHEIKVESENEVKLQSSAKEQLAAAVLNSQFMRVLIDALQVPVQEAVLGFLKEEMARQTNQMVQTLEKQLPDLLKNTVEKYLKENQDDIINFEDNKKNI